MAIIRAIFQLNSLRSTAPRNNKHQEKLDVRHKNHNTIQGLFLHDMLSLWCSSAKISSQLRIWFKSQTLIRPYKHKREGGKKHRWVHKHTSPCLFWCPCRVVGRVRLDSKGMCFCSGFSSGSYSRSTCAGENTPFKHSSPQVMHDTICWETSSERVCVCNRGFPERTTMSLLWKSSGAYTRRAQS